MHTIHTRTHIYPYISMCTWAVVNQSGSVASAEDAAIQAVRRKTPFHPAYCCSMPSGKPATAPPT